MRFTKFFAAAALAFVLGAPAAQADPVMQLPDLTFAARSDGRSGQGLDGNCPVLFNESTFTMLVSRSLGDVTALNNGDGYTLTESTIFQISGSGAPTELGFHYGAGINVTLGPGITLSLSGDLDLVRTQVGYDGLALMTVVAADANSPWEVGDKVALDLHIFNVHDITVGTGTDARTWLCGDVKGDVALVERPAPPAPVIPEPASLGLVGLGLVSFMARARRKLAC